MSSNSTSCRFSNDKIKKLCLRTTFERTSNSTNLHTFQKMRAKSAHHKTSIPYVMLKYSLKEWLHGEFQPGLKFQPGLPGWDFSPGSERNPFEIKVAITWRRFPARAEFQTGLRILARFKNRARIFGPGWKCSSLVEGWKSSCNRSKISARVETWVWVGALTESEIQRNKMAAMEKLCLNPGWN